MRTSITFSLVSFVECTNSIPISHYENTDADTTTWIRHETDIYRDMKILQEYDPTRQGHQILASIYNYIYIQCYQADFFCETIV